MTVSGGRANAQKTATRTLQASGRDVINVGTSACEEVSRHDRYCASDHDNARHIAVFRWLIGRS